MAPNGPCGPPILCFVARGLIWIAVVLAPNCLLGQLQFEKEPIRYHDAATDDRVAQLQRRLQADEAALTHRGALGYLPDLLRLLDVPPSSQMLVFSQTSFQLRKISPRRPRAIYFNDDTYVGWVQGGDIIEVSAVDPDLGAVFYTLEQKELPRPRLVRDRGECLTCHASTRTQGVPGYLVRSVFADNEGRPQLGAGSFTTDHRSPFQERWGGWYVTGTHGKLRHMGNSIAAGGDRPAIDVQAEANRTDLNRLVDTSPYLAPGSDIVALMVLEHQTQMHNYLTLANYETRRAEHYDGIMGKALGEGSEYQSESTKRRITRVAGQLVRYMLFTDEFQLTSPVRGVSGFAAEFSNQGPRDTQGRSLRELDLKSRLFKYPCSYLVYSPAFDRLPEAVVKEVYLRLFQVLTAPGEDPGPNHLSPATRQAIRTILIETKPDLAKRFAQLERAGSR